MGDYEVERAFLREDQGERSRAWADLQYMGVNVVEHG